MLSRYAFTHQRGVGPQTWVVDVFLDLHVPYETLVAVLENMFFNEEAPFQGRNRRVPATYLVYVIQRWWEDSTRAGGLALGGVENCIAMSDTLRVVMTAGVLEEGPMEVARVLRANIEQVLRG